MPILNPPGQLHPDVSDPYGLLALVSNVNNYCVNLVNLTQAGTNLTLTGPQTFTGVVRLVGTASGNFTVTLPITPRLIDALGPTIAKDGSYAVPISIQNEDPTFTATLTAGDALTTLVGTLTIEAGTRRIFLVIVGSVYDPTVLTIYNIGTFTTSGGTPGTGTVTSVGQTVPVEFTISGSPITASGVLAIGKANENAATVWAGPVSGGPAQPTFRAIALSDLPSGFVTSVGLTMPGEFTVSGSPVTSAGTLSVAKATEPANTVWAGPTSGVPAQPTFRAIALSDLPSGFVTSVGLTMPGEFTVSGSPVTSAGTLSVAKATEPANTVWAGPTSGVPAQPAFRALVAADMPSSLSLNQTFATIGAESATLPNSRQLVAGTNVTLTDGGAGSTLTIAASGGGSSGGSLQSQVFTTNGSFVVPSTVTAVWLTMVGGGASGGASLSTGGGAGGGGAGELCEMFMIPVVASSACAVTIGIGGAIASTTPGNNGTASSFNNNTFVFSVAGGTAGGGTGAVPAQGRGGGALGGFNATVNTVGNLGGMESPAHIGGGSGGSGGNPGAGSAGAGAGGVVGGGTGGAGPSGGGGGAATLWGVGGAGGAASNPGASAPATAYGAGGGGGGVPSQNGGAGTNGRVEVYWIG